jgi:integrase/recombinase XerC
MVVRHSESAGIKKQMSPHRIRHSAITAALDATDADVPKVQKLSRHRNLNTLMIYDDNRGRDQQDVTEMLDSMFGMFLLARISNSLIRACFCLPSSL